MEADAMATVSRVMISEHEAVSPHKALGEYKITPDIVFFRRDGWSLGAPAYLEYKAYRLYRDEWTHFIRRSDYENGKSEPVSIKEYLP